VTANGQAVEWKGTGRAAPTAPRKRTRVKGMNAMNSNDEPLMLPGLEPALSVQVVTAQAVVSATIDTMKLHGIPVTSRVKGMLGVQAKELLEDGFDADVILTASVLAIRRGAPGHMHHIAQDLVVARAGQRLGRRDYDAQLDAAQKLLDPAEREHRERLQRILGGDT